MTPEDVRTTVQVPQPIQLGVGSLTWPETLGGTTAILVAAVLGFRRRWSKDSKDINADKAEASFVNTLMSQLQRQEERMTQMEARYQERIAQLEEEARLARIQHTKDAERIATLTEQMASLGQDHLQQADHHRDLVHQLNALKQLLLLYAPEVAAKRILQSDWGALRATDNQKDDGP